MEYTVLWQKILKLMNCYILSLHCPPSLSLLSTVLVPSLVSTAVPLPGWGLSTPRPRLPTAHKRGARPWAGARVWEEPVGDWERARLRVPLPHLPSQGQLRPSSQHHTMNDCLALTLVSLFPPVWPSSLVFCIRCLSKISTVHNTYWWGGLGIVWNN